ncbi:MAG TPA: biotin carboxylase N-terminal domain-containing protein, partial [Candidatus Binatia bacterium]|nr:biotin carboxylase N-terminal domain-containing protein [Candidatus Binatia bacterium]
MRKVLIANRGEIARRIARTCREMGIGTVAVFSEPDRTAPFVGEADEAVAIGGAAPSESYLRIDKLIDAARRTGADAIHPGYGFLAENAELSQRCLDAGLVFIGPPPAVISAMGSKLEAKRRMTGAGVPMLPSGEIPAGNPATNAATKTADLDRLAKEIGLPLLVKASAGGGGKGMRIVREAGELADAVASARREAESAFGDGTVYLERYLEGARHVEVQIFGDTHGNVVHLGERECSIQRRHQKIVEESPCVVLDPTRREAMCDAAVLGGRAIGYVGAGTVEFLFAADGRFYFLEVNTRLQVEHPVTELVTGLDLVRLQIEVARGARLPRQEDLPRARGHAIEVRLYAEDAERDYLPQTGTLRRFEIEPLPGLRVDTGVETGSVVGVHYDPMLAKVIAWASSREESAAKLARGLESARIHGVRTNRRLLCSILRHAEFLAGRTDTGFLERYPASELGRDGYDDDLRREHALVAALALQRNARAEARVLGFAPSGWRNVPSQDQMRSFESGVGRHDVSYCVVRGELHASVDGVAMGMLRLHACGDGVV